MQQSLKIQSYYKNTKHALSIKIKIIMRWSFIPNLKLIKTYYMQVLDGAEYMTQSSCHLQS